MTVGFLLLLFFETSCLLCCLHCDVVLLAYFNVKTSIFRVLINSIINIL
jgi:hypothetical protein